jgi:hypothetical protein
LLLEEIAPQLISIGWPVTPRSNPRNLRTAPKKQQARPEDKAVGLATPLPKENWRRALKPEDEGEIRKWVDQCGLEGVARIIASLANAAGRRGRPEIPDSKLLLKIAFLQKRHLERSLHSIATEVARGARSHHKRGITVESLASKLDRDFRKRRQVWLSLARNLGDVGEKMVDDGVSKLRSSAENRVLGRLIELLPDAIDLYDSMVQEAAAAEPEKAKLIRQLGRRRIETIVDEQIGPLRSFGLGGNFRGPAQVPRSVFGLIEPKLRQVQQELERAPVRRRVVGRKPPE